MWRWRLSPTALPSDIGHCFDRGKLAVSGLRKGLGASIYDIYRILGLFDPLPPLSAKSILFVRNYNAFFDLPSPFCVDVIYGRPLRQDFRALVNNAAGRTAILNGLLIQGGEVSLARKRTGKEVFH